MCKHHGLMILIVSDGFCLDKKFLINYYSLFVFSGKCLPSGTAEALMLVLSAVRHKLTIISRGGKLRLNIYNLFYLFGKQ